jgi:hypothetical protein
MNSLQRYETLDIANVSALCKNMSSPLFKEFHFFLIRGGFMAGNAPTGGLPKKPTWVISNC